MRRMRSHSRRARAAHLRALSDEEARGRSHPLPQGEGGRAEVRRRIRSGQAQGGPHRKPKAAERPPRGQRLHPVRAQRKQTVEPVFGIVKEAMGFRQFLLRGLEKVETEWALVTLAYNCKRLNNLRLA